MKTQTSAANSPGVHLPPELQAELPARSGSTELRKAEWTVAVLLTLLCAGFHVFHLIRAGGLWRDEAAVVGLANLPSVHEVFARFPHEAFPVMFPLTVRAVTRLGGNTDLGFRVFGLLVGLGVLAALWLTRRMLHPGVPLLSLALVGFNAAVFQWGDSLRGYGLGALFMVLSVGLIWRVVEKPSRWSFWAALAASMAAVQCLFHNPPLLLGIGTGAIAVALRRGARKQAALVVLLGVLAAVSLLPYWAPLLLARHWDETVRLPTHLSDLWQGLRDTLGASGWSNIWIWAGLFVLAQSLCWYAQKPGSDRAGSRDLLLFCGVTLLVSVCGCLAFLKILSYLPRPWYFVALIATTGVLIDAAVDILQFRWARIARLALAGAVVLTSVPVAWRTAGTRQTNVDLVAAQMNAVQAQDLIIVRPWYMGISFARYYTGSAPWMTVPPIEFHQFHRYDLIRIQAERPNPNEVLQPLLEKISATLKSGHAVWLIGQRAWNADPTGVQNQSDIAFSNWSRQLVTFLRASASHVHPVGVECPSPVNPREDLPVWKLDGWSGGRSEISRPLPGNPSVTAGQR